MKKILALILCLVPLCATAQKDIKKTLLEKKYTTTESPIIKIQSEYCDVEVESSSYTKNMSLRCVVEIDDDFRGGVDELLNSIRIVERFEGGVLFVEARVVEPKRFGGDFKVECLVRVPSGYSAELVARYSEVDIEGSGEIVDLSVDAHYSDVEVRSGVRRAVVMCEYSEVEMRSVGEVDFSGVYSKFEAKNVENAALVARYSEVSIDKLTGEVSKADVGYGVVSIGCSKSVSQLNFTGLDYSEMKVKFLDWVPNLKTNYSTHYSTVTNKLKSVVGNSKEMRFNLAAKYSTVVLKED